MIAVEYSSKFSYHQDILTTIYFRLKEFIKYLKMLNILGAESKKHVIKA